MEKITRAAGFQREDFVAGAGAGTFTGGPRLSPCIEHLTACGREKIGRKRSEPSGGVGVAWRGVVESGCAMFLVVLAS